MTKKDYIDNKVKGIIFSKKKNLENIASKFDEKFEKNYTFFPATNTNYELVKKRELNQFLEDQNFHLKKIEDKRNQVYIKNKKTL